MKKYLVPLLIFGFILRFWNLTNFPVGFTADEASHGYDAFSLLTTGKDQWGQAWPLTFRSFGDFKLPVYTYITIPFVFFGGLTELMTRLPGALFGTAAILMTYLFAIELFKESMDKKWGFKIGLLSAFALAISPWHIQLSRGALEANLTSFFATAAIWTWLKGMQHAKNNATFNRWWLATSLLFGVNLYTYHAARAFALLLIPLLAIVTWKRLKISCGRLLTTNWLPIFILAIFSIPMGISLFNGGSSRGLDVAIFNPTDNWSAVSEKRHEAVLNNLPDSVARLTSNKVTHTLRRFTTNYLTYLSPKFLFDQGPGESSYGMLPGRGVLYWFELPLILLSLFYAIRKPNKQLNLLLGIILLAPIAAALSKGGGLAANRAATMLPFIHILSVYGLYSIFKNLKRTWIPAFTGITSVSVLIFFSFFLEDYIYHAPRFQAKGMAFGWSSAMRTIREVEDNYDQIIISRKFTEPQIYPLFYNAMDPAIPQSASTDWLRYEEENLPFLDQLGEYHLGKYTFRGINREDLLLESTLLVGKFEDFAPDIQTINTVFRPAYPEAKPEILIVDPAQFNNNN